MYPYKLSGTTVVSFSGGRPRYQQVLDYSDTQFDMFADHDEAIFFFCGD